MLFLLLPFLAWSQSDKICGYYYVIEPDTKEESQIEIFKNDNGTYSGKIVWMKNPTDKNGKIKCDVKNPDVYWHTHSPIGMSILKNFVFNAKDENWDSGTIYNPGNGKTYKCKLSFSKPNQLKVRGYIGVPALGQTEYWTKENQLRKN